MSFIDTVVHEMCGMIADLPLYRPCQPVSGEFDATEHQLLIGGGSGEHPAAVVDVPAAVSRVVDVYTDLLACPRCQGEGDVGGEVNGAPIGCPDCEGTGQRTGGEYEYAVEYASEHDLTVPGLWDLADALVAGNHGRVASAVDFSSWAGDDWARAVKAARRSPNAPYRRKRHQTIESWFAVCVGEFALVSYPQLLADDPTVTLTDAQRRTLEVLRELAARRAMCAAVTQVPSGYQMGGRGEHLWQSNMRH